MPAMECGVSVSFAGRCGQGLFGDFIHFFAPSCSIVRISLEWRAGSPERSSFESACRELLAVMWNTAL